MIRSKAKLYHSFSLSIYKECYNIINVLAIVTVTILWSFSNNG